MALTLYYQLLTIPCDLKSKESSDIAYFSSVTAISPTTTSLRDA